MTRWICCFIFYKKCFDICAEVCFIQDSLLLHRLMVGHDTLDVGILVRIQVKQP